MEMRQFEVGELIVHPYISRTLRNVSEVARYY